MVSTPCDTVPVKKTLPPRLPGLSIATPRSIFRQLAPVASSHNIVDPSALRVKIPQTATVVPSGQLSARWTLIGIFAGSVWTQCTAAVLVLIGTALITCAVVVAAAVVVVPVARASLVHAAATSTAAVNSIGANLTGGWTSATPGQFHLLRIR